MRPLRKNSSLFAVDLSRVFDRPGDLPRRLLREAIGSFNSGTLSARSVIPARVHTSIGVLMAASVAAGIRVPG